MAEYTEGQIVSHRIIESRLGYEHIQVSRHHGNSALRRVAVCGSMPYVQVHTGFDAYDTSWYPKDDGRNWAIGFLLRHAQQGYRVCKKCREWAERNATSVSSGKASDDIGDTDD